MAGLLWHGTRRRLVASAGGAGLAITSGVSPHTEAQEAGTAVPNASPPTAGSVSLDPSSPTELGAPAVPEPSVSTASDAVPVAIALAPYAQFGTDAAPGVFPRVIRHAFGETTIEKRPERVVVLDSGELDAAIYLDIIPVGAAEYQSRGPPDYVVQRVADIPLVGTTAEPDMEAIIAIQPDLIISSKLRHDEQLYKFFSGIAPTVFAERPGVSFKYNFKLYAQALGREVEGRAVIDRYEDGCRKLNASLPSRRPITSIVQIRADEVRFYQRANFLGTVLTDLGLPRSESENVDDFAFTGSQENLGTYADGELIILAIAGGDTNEIAPEILNSPVWKSLPAVKGDSVMEVSSDTFIGGIGYGAAMDVVNTIGDYFGIPPVIDTTR